MPERASGNGGIGKLERKAEAESWNGKLKRKAESGNYRQYRSAHAHIGADQSVASCCKMEGEREVSVLAVSFAIVTLVATACVFLFHLHPVSPPVVVSHCHFE